MCVTSQIRKLEHDLQSQEQYIKYLYSIIEGHETEIENLRCKNKELREKLRNALQLISLKEKGEQELVHQLIEANTINIQLKNRIKELISKTCKSGQDMAQPNSIDAILGCRQFITDNLIGIR